MDAVGESRRIEVVVRQRQVVGGGVEEVGSVRVYVYPGLLQGRQVSLTTVISGIFDEKWLLEIEAVAAA